MSPSSAPARIAIATDAAAPAVGDACGSLELEDAWLMDPATGREGRGSISVDAGIITSVQWDDETGGEPPSVVVAPGFIDLHTHLRDPGDEDAETYATGLAAAAHGGFTWICTLPDTRPTVDRPEVVQRVRAAAAAAGSPVRARPYGAMTAGREGASLAPFAALAAAGVVGFTDDPSPMGDSGILRAALTEAGALGLPVVVHADEPSLTGGAEANEGLPATILGLLGATPAAEVSAVARAVAVLRQVTQESPPDVRPHLHIAHLSTADALEPLRAARAEGLQVTCDVTPHHLALHDGWPGGDRRYSWDATAAPWSGGRSEAEPYDTQTRVEPPLRAPSDAMALLAALGDGTIDAIATDHSPWRAVDKEVPFGEAHPGIGGIETCLGLVLEVVASGRVALMPVMRALTTGPWRALGGREGVIPEPGLAEGAPANLVVFDRADRWTVERRALRSRGSGSPLMGRTLPGRVLLTVARGRVAWVDPALG